MARSNVNSPRATRRAFLGGAAALAACGLAPRISWGADASRPNSVFGGVRIGCISYSYRGAIETAEDTLKALIDDGLSEVELMDGPIRSYIGLGAAAAPPTDEARQACLTRCAALRKLYNDAGVTIHAHKMRFGRTDDEIAFSFEVAKALGCSAITLERSEDMARKLAPFAEKFKIWIGFHNHTNNYPVMDRPDPILDAGPYIGFNLDIGHYVAGSRGKSPIPVLEKYHDRIVSLHLKDRTASGGNVPWGEGDTPLKEVLQLMKKEKWTFPGDIEVEYKIPAGSTPVAEVARCVRYCKEALA